MKNLYIITVIFFATAAQAQRPYYGDWRVTGALAGESVAATSAIEAASYVFSASDVILNVGILSGSDAGKALIYDPTENDIHLTTITIPSLDALGGVDISGATTGQVLGLGADGIWEATESAVEAARDYSIAGSISGKPATGELLLMVPFVNSVRFSSGLTGSLVVAATAATNSSTFSIYKNDLKFGTITFPASASQAILAATQTDFSSGDLIKILAPDPQDTTLEYLGINLVGVRQ